MRLIKPIKVIIVVTFVFLLIASSIFFSISKTLKKKEAFEKRALLMVVENNDHLGVDDTSFYDDNRAITQAIFSYLFGVKQRDIEDMELVDIVDDYGEEWLISEFKSAVPMYGKYVALTDETATYEQFKSQLIELSEDGYTVDILFHLHGSEEVIVFANNEFIFSDQIISDLKSLNLNIGFVYQTLCEGSTMSDTWADIGAAVSNGAEETNYYVLLAPQRFLKNWGMGKTFEDSVEESFNFEVKLWNRLSFIVPSLDTWTDPQHVADSVPVISGDTDYWYGSGNEIN